jgi:AbrB family looped-hinge helix DNA binding protein
MPTLKLHYEGWVSLPAALRQRLGLNSGDRLDVDLIDGTIVLRPAAKVKRPFPRADQEAAIDPPVLEAPETLTHADAPAGRRKPGRPRTREAGDELAVPARKRPRGRPKAVRAPEPEPAPVRAIGSEPWKLRRKADLQAQAASVEYAPLPSPRPYRARSEAGSPAEERRPFRNVEVRKLGPGRRHNRPQAPVRATHPST